MQNENMLFNLLFPDEKALTTSHDIESSNHDDVSFSVLSAATEDSSSICKLSYSSPDDEDRINRPFKIIREQPKDEF